MDTPPLPFAFPDAFLNRKEMRVTGGSSTHHKDSSWQCAGHVDFISPMHHYQEWLTGSDYVASLLAEEQKK